MKPPYRRLDELLDLIDEPLRTCCRRLLQENRELFAAAPGSTGNHQAWPGGYLDHVTEIMNAAALLYPCLSAARPLPFSFSDALLVTFLHDLEKPWKYEPGEDGRLRHRAGLASKAEHQAFRERMLLRYGIVLSPEQANGLKYVEGELADYSNQRRVMGPLAAFCHMCDVASARIWFDHPAAAADPWAGAQRVRSVPGP